MEETLPAFGVTFAKPFLLKMQYSKPSKIIEIWALHISVFVSMTNIIVKSYAVQHMCMEVIICQSERSPEIVMISQTPTIGGNNNTSDGSRSMAGNSPSFLDDFCKTLLTQNRTIETFQKCRNLDLRHVSICIYRSYNL